MLKLPTRSLVQLIGCLVVTVAVGMLMIVPAYRSLGEKDRLAAKIRTDIESQKVLAPLFKEMFKKVKLKETGALTPVEVSPWPRERTGDLPLQFESMGKKYDLEVEARLPDAATLIQQAKHLDVDIVVRGRFADFRPFFLSLYQTPFIEYVERIQILAGDGREEMRIKLWVAQK